ncbi:MAG: hypothetical protein K0R38_3828 [Polyangiaceae bacterium]|jgi:mono/diheme cytochrome c family protein|nr:hypothetical protein [Polyangiaceae bacterium]
MTGALGAALAIACGSDPPPPAGNGGSDAGGSSFSGAPSGNQGGEPGSNGGSATVGGAADSACTPVQSEHAIPARAALYTRASGSTEHVQFVSELVSRFDGFCAGCHRSPASQGNFSYTAESFATSVGPTAIERILAEDPVKRMPPASPFPIRDDLKVLASDLQAWMDQGRPTVTYTPPASNGADPGEADNPYAMDERAALGQTNLGDCIPSKEIIGSDWNEEDDAREARFEAIDSFADLPKKLSETDLFTLDTETLARHNTIAVAPTYQLWSFDAGKLRYLHLPRGTSLHYDAELKTFVSPPNTRLYKTFTKPVTDKYGQVGWRKIETRLIIARADVDAEGAMQYRAIFGTYLWNEAETEATLLEKPYLGTDLSDPELNRYTFKDIIVPYVEDERVFRKNLEAVGNQTGSVVLRPIAGEKEYPVPGWHRCEQCHQGSPTKDFLLGVNPTQLNRRPIGEGGVYEDAGPDELSQAQRLIDYGFITGVSSPDEFIKLEDSAGERKPRNAYELRAQAYALGNCSGCHNQRGYPTRLNPSLAEFDFLPGGIFFQFPLAKTSPLRVRGTEAVPYVQPLLSARTIDRKGQSVNATTVEKARAVTGDPTIAERLQQNVAPWSSLIYRNVQAPRTYGEDDILYPHMPLHVAGIDCRAPTIMGSWIASIPTARRDAATLEESSTPAALAEADERVRRFLAQQPECKPAEDLRDWGAVSPAYTDAAPPWDIPDRPHWFEEDFTEVAGDFAPRNSKWETALLDQKFAYIRDFEPSADLQAFVKKDVPFDFWKDKPTCDFTNAPAVEALPYWAESDKRIASNMPDIGDPKRVFSTLPGAAVFDAICSNCHGQRGTAESNLASTIANLTGGTTRVANYAQGLFGPLDNRTHNLSFFTDKKLADGTSLGEFGAAKYLLFMALGGTEAVIPAAALRQVAAAKVASQTRPGNVADFASANMLEVAKEVCANTLQFSSANDLALASAKYAPEVGMLADPMAGQVGAGIAVRRNGELLLYRELCAIDNPRPAREIEFNEVVPGQPLVGSVVGFFDRASYTGNLSGPAGDPFCTGQVSLVNPKGIAVCNASSNGGSDVANEWVRRGALNVGFAVYDYLKSSFADPTHWRPTYDQCELRYPRN